MNGLGGPTQIIYIIQNEVEEGKSSYFGQAVLSSAVALAGDQPLPTSSGVGVTTSVVKSASAVVGEVGQGASHLNAAVGDADADSSGTSHVEPAKPVADVGTASPQHVCELCRQTFDTQFDFYQHLRTHYEPVPSTSDNPSSEVKPKKGRTRKKGVGGSDDKAVGRKTAKAASKAALEAGRLTETVTNIIEDNDGIQQVGNSSSNNALSTGSSQNESTTTSTKSNHKIRKVGSFQLHTGTGKGSKRAPKPSGSKTCEKIVECLPANAKLQKSEGIANLVEFEDGSEDLDTFLDDAHQLIDDEDEETEMMYLQSNICPSCDAPCETKDSLEKHMLDQHPEIFLVGPEPPGNDGSKKKSSRTQPSKKTLKCLQCPKVFNHRNSLIYHMRSHTGERPFACDICGKRFFATSALKVHKRVHSGEKPYRCDECDKNFRQWGDLKYHKISIHSNERAHQCEFCGKSFARKYSLIVHRKIHTGERNYRCEFCLKTFRAASYLQNHRRIHTGEKPHACAICGRAFRVRSDMKRHMATHNRDVTSIEVTTNHAVDIVKL